MTRPRGKQAQAVDTEFAPAPHAVENVGGVAEGCDHERPGFPLSRAEGAGFRRVRGSSRHLLPWHDTRGGRYWRVPCRAAIEWRKMPSGRGTIRRRLVPGDEGCRGNFAVAG